MQNNSNKPSIKKHGTLLNHQCELTISLFFSKNVALHIDETKICDKEISTINNVFFEEKQTKHILQNAEVALSKLCSF